MIGFIIGLTTGFSIVTGQKFGAGDIDGVKKSVAACAVLSFASMVVLVVVGVAFAMPALQLMQTPPEIIEDAYSFISIICAGIGVTMFVNMLSNLLRVLGDSRTPLFFLIFAVVLNIVLELLFILYFSMGVAGAAWATVGGQLISGIAALFYIKKYVPILHLRRSDWKVSRDMLWQHVKMGLPMAFQASIISIGAIILQISLNQLGPVAVAAFSAAQKVDMLANMPMMSFGMTMAVYTAQNYGAKNYARIRLGVRQCIMMSVSFAIACGLINIVFATDMMKAFVGEGQPEVVAYGQTYLNITGASYFILALLFIYRYTLQGLGKSFAPTLAGVMELVMRVFAAVVVTAYFGYTGACLANPFAWIGAAVPLGIAYYLAMCKLEKESKEAC